MTRGGVGWEQCWWLGQRLRVRGAGAVLLGDPGRSGEGQGKEEGSGWGNVRCGWKATRRQNEGRVEWDRAQSGWCRGWQGKGLAQNAKARVGQAGVMFSRVENFLVLFPRGSGAWFFQLRFYAPVH